MLQSMGSQRVGHDLVTEQEQYLKMEWKNSTRLNTFSYCIRNKNLSFWLNVICV